MNDIRYLASFKTNRSACMVRVNNFPMIENFTYKSGSVTTGFNITAFVENGLNHVELLMGAVDPGDSSTLYPDSNCELIITKETPTSSQQVTSLVLSVDKNGEIISSNSSNYSDSSKESQVDEEQFPADQEEKLFRVGRDVKFSGLPVWAWVNATPVTEKTLPGIKETYRTIWKEMNARNIDFFKEMTTVSSAEMGRAEGISSELLFKSYGLEGKLENQELSPIPLDVDSYKLITYCGGRVFRLALGIYQNSPLRLKSATGRAVFSYNPYLSIVNGRIIVVR